MALLTAHILDIPAFIPVSAFLGPAASALFPIPFFLSQVVMFSILRKASFGTKYSLVDCNHSTLCIAVCYTHTQTERETTHIFLSRTYSWRTITEFGKVTGPVFPLQTICQLEGKTVQVYIQYVCTMDTESAHHGKYPLRQLFFLSWRTVICILLALIKRWGKLKRTISVG